ncbi:MAG: (E)-4-hydroxy-3-methylbut-2-enyl-diphosphate synthase [Chitinophagaceae bacterium]|jgi:(E)-4-hydroxy-3-methylbut-2-enyl-diphosphate synthase|nr:(E)-4-hydroxy-3-methylbut-2-enyl-diphosphate synthase [Chitinophagaceae bacterium]MCE2973097.1 (E)-4-hydroxy-3-methylbut-2-enyl-diphosphate synthase [Sediminibacterium sp.]MCA6487603.1 (E)-4-hydroxy-3-methylbut-2-enyl-diphosphate synthase [Chitinophagaceae bacterium]MCA6489652.1 (E)-4-hydroxy-3-methylbut-2-enyl-diphosphate synthase [Chitinophagaceae bacterium]MCA6491167.1 (E)-4-hydroxy-3-methylbut-2-enyl-diphosphate synthase [Chitinophagaceae bacterium]
MQLYCNSLTSISRLKTREVSIGGLLMGNGHPIRVQTMTTTDTMDTLATVEQSIRCIEAGAELVRITAPSKKEAENLLLIKNELRKRGYHTPLVADIHFTPNAAEIAARIVEKVRVNPGNYVDKKKFEQIDYTDAEYLEEIDRIREKFTPLVRICKEYGTAMRIGTNHGSLSDRIMSRYGDTPIGMVESAMEFLRIARDENFHQIVLSMKASNPKVMVQAYRLLVQQMLTSFGECYPLHLGVTEAGDGEDGRIKSAAGIGTLLEDGIGDTIRVSLTEDPEFEIPVCRDLVKRYVFPSTETALIPSVQKIPYDPFSYQRRTSFAVGNIGQQQVPVVIADLSRLKNIEPADLLKVGYNYDATTDKWNISDTAADYIFTGNSLLNFELPGTLRVVTYPATWEQVAEHSSYVPLFSTSGYLAAAHKSNHMNIVMVDCFSDNSDINDFTGLDELANDPTVVLALSSRSRHAMPAVRRMFMELMNRKINNPVILICDSNHLTTDEHLIHFATECGALLLDGMGDGICLGMTTESYAINSKEQTTISGRNYVQLNGPEEFMNATAFGILQATRTRISKTEYISCPSCGRTLFDLQETTARIRKVTHHLKGVKIAIMGCIVNGPGEMADADFGYVGSGPGKITLYKGKDIMKRNIDSEIAVQELINLLKEHDAWIEPASA